MKHDAAKEIICVLMQIMRISEGEIKLHFNEPLNGYFFLFDAIKMTYFILELRKRLRIEFSLEGLRTCSYWSPQEFVDFCIQQLECESVE